jgi:hypothetical protein
MNEKENKKMGEIILRSHLLRCFDDVIKEFPGVNGLPKEEAVDYLLKLRREGSIKITLNTVNQLIETKIDWIQ